MQGYGSKSTLPNKEGEMTCPTRPRVIHLFIPRSSRLPFTDEWRITPPEGNLLAPTRTLTSNTVIPERRSPSIEDRIGRVGFRRRVSSFSRTEPLVSRRPTCLSGAADKKAGTYTYVRPSFLYGDNSCSTIRTRPFHTRGRILRRDKGLRSVGVLVRRSQKNCPLISGIVESSQHCGWPEIGTLVGMLGKHFDIFQSPTPCFGSL